MNEKKERDVPFNVFVFIDSAVGLDLKILRKSTWDIFFFFVLFYLKLKERDLQKKK